MAGRIYPKNEVRGRVPGGATPCQRQGAADRRSYPMLEARSGSWEDHPHVQGAVAVSSQEGLEELSHIEDQEGWW